MLHHFHPYVCSPRPSLDRRPNAIEVGGRWYVPIGRYMILINRKLFIIIEHSRRYVRY